MAKPGCPECSSHNVVRIVYGFPGPEMAERYKRGEIVLGGCCIGGDDPEWQCKTCDHEWSSMPARPRKVRSDTLRYEAHTPSRPAARTETPPVGFWQMLRNLFNNSGTLPGDGFDGDSY